MEMNGDDDRCKMTGLKRGSCYHCQAPPEYSIKETVYKGLPVIELLHRGGPIHEFDQHFRFGKNKAKLIIACMNIVKELAATPYGEMPDIQNQTVVDSESGKICVEVECFKEFQHSTGRTINVPWIRLQSGNYPDLQIGLGRRKAIAIVSVGKKLTEWVNNINEVKLWEKK